MSSSTTRSKQTLRLWLRLLSCANLIEQEIRSRLRSEFNITLPQFDVLSELERAGQPQTMSELSRLLLVSNGNVTGVVDRLERDGLVNRRPAQHDRRVLYIELTDDGRELFKRIAAVHETWVAGLLAGLSESTTEQLIDLLGQTKHAIKEGQ